MKGVDTNVLIRYFVRDDEEQWKKAYSYLGQNVSGESYFISNVVLCETIWVLKAIYKRRKLELVTLLKELLKKDSLVLENELACRAALMKYEDGKGDFADYLIGQVNRGVGCVATVTFDQKLADDETFEVLDN